jgi:hypothetical protein
MTIVHRPRVGAAPAYVRVLILPSALWAGWGCTGGGQVELTALDYQMIDPPAAKMAKMDVDRAFWWQDAEGYVWIGLERVTAPLFGRFGTFSFQHSFAVDRPPASKRGRNYILGTREFRARYKLGPSESRFVSRTGILALYPEPGDRMRGTFKLEAMRQTSRLLGGWGPATRYLLMGSFVAVHDAGRGEAIATATESNGWDRGPRATSQPARLIRPARRPATTSSPTTQPAPP